MKIIVNPKYAGIRDYLEHIDEHFEREGREIFRDRNVVNTLKVGPLTLCVKKYATPSLRRRVETSLYKTPKGKLAYLSPLLLRERGFESPEPVAYVKYDIGLFRSESYFVCLHSDYRYSMDMLDQLPGEQRREVVESFARYAARLHEDGFLHRDFSSGNILFDRVKGRYRFSLIDTNSIRCGRPVGVKKGCENFCRLRLDDVAFTWLAEAYAAERKADPLRCLHLICEARRLYLRKLGLPSGRA